MQSIQTSFGIKFHYVSVLLLPTFLCNWKLCEHMPLEIVNCVTQNLVLVKKYFLIIPQVPFYEVAPTYYKIEIFHLFC